ncbi:GyrI-like domain-containing protein [Paenibacillus chartarius]|uniref:GyrI-like domain-containing protein n=1 Tax=Paenibacillus chartarius TaxID=747481 RepID=A0ABV6DE29_9BACL
MELNEDHIFKVNQAMYFIETHLDRELSLREISEVVAFSPFHFHRMFSIVTGETLHSYVLRVRLETAARHILLYPGDSITDISARLGFSSISNFSRAFQKRFGMAPIQYRRSGKQAPQLAPRSLPTPTNLQPPSYPIEIRSLPSLYVACKPFRQARMGLMNNKVTSAFRDVGDWCRRNVPDQAPRTTLLSSGEENWHILPNSMAYDACMTVPDHIVSEAQAIRTKRLPGGLYAVCRLEKRAEHPSAFAEAIREMTWASEHMYVHWIPNHSYRLDDRPGLHIFYTEPTNPSIVMECCLPIAPLNPQKSKK